MIAGAPEAEEWPAWANWSYESLLAKLGSCELKVGKDDSGRPVSLTLNDFGEYMRSQQDDSPVYVFENRFRGPVASLLNDFKVPKYFPDDYMALTADRPPYRWVGLGPKRSGTAMHTDPLVTSAWNTLIAGRKLWLLFPPGVPRTLAKAKNVMGKDDDDEAINHFLDLLPRQLSGSDQKVVPLICVQQPGDTIYVPGNWWHCVLNLDDTIAVTQNYCGRNNFPKVWASAREERPCWSHRWLAAMPPELAERARLINTADGFVMEQQLTRNRERRDRQQQRRDQRALAKARKADGFDEEQWWEARGRKRRAVNDDSTVSTTSSSEDDDSSSSESSSD